MTTECFVSWSYSNLFIYALFGGTHPTSACEYCHSHCHTHCHTHSYTLSYTPSYTLPYALLPGTNSFRLSLAVNQAQACTSKWDFWAALPSPWPTTLTQTFGMYDVCGKTYSTIFVFRYFSPLTGHKTSWSSYSTRVKIYITFPHGKAIWRW